MLCWQCCFHVAVWLLLFGVLLSVSLQLVLPSWWIVCWLNLYLGFAVVRHSLPGSFVFSLAGGGRVHDEG